MAYTENKKIGGLISVDPLDDTNTFAVEQGGIAKKATLAELETKILDAKPSVSPTTSDVVIIRRLDGSIAQTSLNTIVPENSVTNAMVAGAAAIAPSKLAVIDIAGKVTNVAVQAVTGSVVVGGAYDNSVGAGRIVARDATGNFAAGTVTAALTGNATTATNLNKTAASPAAPGVVYQAGTTTTNLLANSATSGHVLTSTGVNTAPTWQQPPGGGTVTSANNLSGGSFMTIPVQSSAGVTIYTDAGQAGQFLVGNGINVKPSWVSGSSAATSSTLVRRDSNGNFAGTIITGNLTGNVTSSGASSFNTLSTSGAATLASVSVSGAASVTGNASVAGTLTVTGALTATGGVTGNVATATKLLTARNLALTGDVTATLSNFDGSAAVSAVATIGAGKVKAANLDGAQTGAAPIYGVRAWVNFDGSRNVTDTGASANNGAVKIRGQSNVTSVTRIITGVFEILMTASPETSTNNNYAVVGTGTVDCRIDNFEKTSTVFRVRFINLSGTLVNDTQGNIMVIR